MLAKELLRFLPFRDLVDRPPGGLRADFMAASSVLFLSVPQGVAYAMIAGLPPVMGLYAGTLPTIFGSLFRSSRHVMTGPTNALSLLVGTAIAANVSNDPVAIATTLAVMVGAIQVTAGLLKLGALVDYISSAVVLGYVTGAGVLVGTGQLGNITATSMGEGKLFTRLATWSTTIGDADPRTIIIAALTALGILTLRKWRPGTPAPIVMIATAIATTWLFDLGRLGIPLIDDLAPVPAGLPPIAIPSLDGVQHLLPLAIAAAVLSLVESSSVGRTIAGRTGQRLDASAEFAGQGLANIASGLCGGYPVSGSLARSTLNEKLGATSRLSGVMNGLLMLVSLLFLGPIINLTPVSSLAGLIVIIASDLIDLPQIRRVMRSNLGDRLAFVGTVLGTWLLALDQAIYLGVAISLVLFLQRVRKIAVHDIAINEHHHLQESIPSVYPDSTQATCTAIRVVHVEGSLFFGAANELSTALDRLIVDPDMAVLVVRLKRARGLDFTSAQVLERLYRRVNELGKHMLLVGMTPEMMAMMQRLGLTAEMSSADLYPTNAGWFDALNEALAQAVRLTGEHACGTDCPVVAYLTTQGSLSPRNDN